MWQSSRTAAEVLADEWPMEQDREAGSPVGSVPLRGPTMDQRKVDERVKVERDCQSFLYRRCPVDGVKSIYKVAHCGEGSSKLSLDRERSLAVGLYFRLAMGPMTVAARRRWIESTHFIGQEVCGVRWEMCQRVDTVSAWVARRT